MDNIAPDMIAALDTLRQAFTKTDMADVTFEDGPKFIKILRIVPHQCRYTTLPDGSRERTPTTVICGFIVKDDYKIFQRGDLLQAKHMNAPTFSRSHGNVLDFDASKIRWTGIGA